MQITILCVGKLKEKFYEDGCKEFIKRLQRYCKVEVVEVKDEKAPESLSAAQIEQLKKREGHSLLDKMNPDALNIALCLEGEPFNSIEWANALQKEMNDGNSHFCFIIGGSNGLSNEVITRCKRRLSFSDFTFSHQLMRLILLEQIYRAFKILRNEPYHK